MNEFSGEWTWLVEIDTNATVTQITPLHNESNRKESLNVKHIKP